MANAELAELRGAIFGLKALVFNCLSSIAGRFDDPNAYLDELQQQAVLGIAQSSPTNIRPQHLETFRNAAVGVVLQAIGAVKETHARDARPPTRQ